MYNANYYKTYGIGEDYSNRDIWVDHFKRIAEQIVREFNPKTFLDVGCAYGYLVENLRDMGIEAYGIDISDYAISQAREDIKEYLFVADFTDKLPDEMPQKFDCVSTIEVIEHVKEEYCDSFMDSLCKLSDIVIFSSTPSDIKEKTHCNVQQPEYWCKRFAKRNFYRNTLVSNLNLSPDEMVFYKKEDYKKYEIIEDYEHTIRLQIMSFKEQMDMKEQHILNLNNYIKELEEKNKALEEKNKVLEIENERKINELKNIYDSKLFKYTSFLRK